MNLAQKNCSEKQPIVESSALAEEIGRVFETPHLYLSTRDRVLKLLDRYEPVKIFACNADQADLHAIECAIAAMGNLADCDVPLPEGDSDDEATCLAEVCRQWLDARGLWECSGDIGGSAASPVAKAPSRLWKIVQLVAGMFRCESSKGE